MLNAIINAYNLLLNDGIVKRDWDEDRITQALFFNLQENWFDLTTKKEREKFRPIPQFGIYPKLGKRGSSRRIDFAFSGGYKDEENYVGFECKKIASKNRRLMVGYVKEGMMRHISGAYSRKGKLGGMIGYMHERTINPIISGINLTIVSTNGLSSSDRISNTGMSLAGFKHIYSSSHVRGSLPPISLYHLFMSFII